MSLLADLSMFGRFATGMRRFLGGTVTPEEGRAVMTASLAHPNGNRVS